jgi:DNA-binding response OmpR family regulator
MTESTDSKSILHVSTRDVLRPIRDQVLRLAGFEVESCDNFQSGLTTFHARPFDLVLIDVEGTEVIPQAERLCSEVKMTRNEQLVAFVCNWRVAILTDCPDEILRTEFDPAAFVAGVRRVLEVGPGA